MVLQIRFTIWLTLQIEVEALHICKPSHHFASTISAFHVGLCTPPTSPPRAISLRSSALPAARAPSSCRPCPPSLQLPCAPDTDANDDGDERRTQPGLGGDWREDLGWAAIGGDLAWAATGTHDVRQNGAKEKNTRARSLRQNSEVGSTLWVCQV